MDLPSWLEQSFILLDTCLLIDSSQHDKEFAPLFEALNQKNITYVSISFVRIEFIRDIRTENVAIKENLFDTLVETELPITGDMYEYVKELLRTSGTGLNKASITDIYLGAALKKYKNLYLLTNNHKDFPISIYNRKLIIPIGLDKEIRSYALYEFKKNEDVDEDILPF